MCDFIAALGWLRSKGWVELRTSKRTEFTAGASVTERSSSGRTSDRLPPALRKLWSSLRLVLSARVQQQANSDRHVLYSTGFCHLMVHAS
jgi:hypothetical protein